MQVIGVQVLEVKRWPEARACEVSLLRQGSGSELKGERAGVVRDVPLGGDARSVES
jgi:hypothetical protein